MVESLPEPCDLVDGSDDPGRRRTSLEDRCRPRSRGSASPRYQSCDPPRRVQVEKKQRARIMKRRAVARVGLWVVLLLIVALGTPPSVPSIGRPVAAAPFSVSFSWSPSTVMANSQMQGMVTFSAGAVPFNVWLNQTPPGCAPSQVPFVTSNYSNSCQCTPTSSATYDVHLDTVDNTGTRESATATLTVQSGGGNGGGGGGNGTNPLSGLQDLLPVFFTFAI